MARLPVRVFFVAIKYLRYLVESTDLGKQQNNCGNGVNSCRGYHGPQLPASKPEPTILEWIDAASLLHALANAVYLPRSWHFAFPFSAKPVRQRDRSCEVVSVSGVPSQGPSRETRDCELYLVVAF
jgi:hypothetical protein